MNYTCDKLLRRRSTNHGRVRFPWPFLRTLLLAMMLSVPVHGAATEAADDLSHLADVLATAPHQIRADLMRDRYRALHGPARLNQLSTEQLLKRFKAAETAAFYSHDPAIAIEVRDIYMRLRELRATDASHALSALGTLAQARELELAHAFNREEKVVPEDSLIRLAYAPAPQANRRTVLDVKGADLVPRGVDLSTGLRILVLAHPSCGYSRQAADAIEADGALRTFFERHALWIAPPTRELTNNGTTEWNIQRPGQRLVVAYRTSDWPDIGDWSTPTFYVFWNGQLVRTLAGWSKDGATHRQLTELLHAVSVAQP